MNRKLFALGIVSLAISVPAFAAHSCPRLAGLWSCLASGDDPTQAQVTEVTQERDSKGVVKYVFQSPEDQDPVPNITDGRWYPLSQESGLEMKSSCSRRKLLISVRNIKDRSPLAHLSAEKTKDGDMRISSELEVGGQRTTTEEVCLKVATPQN